MTCHTRWGYTNRAVQTPIVVYSEKELPEALSITHSEDRPRQRGTSSSNRRDTASTPDPPAAARVRQAPTVSLHRSSAQIQAQAAGIDIRSISTEDRLGVFSHTKCRLKNLPLPCCPPLPERYAARIVKGEYVSFDKLITTKERQDFSKQSFKQPRTVTGLASWLEAWN